MVALVLFALDENEKRIKIERKYEQLKRIRNR
jgi:hypothetical protein